MTADANLLKTILNLKDRINKLLQHQKTKDPTQRILIALAGVPGSGKSTISDALLRLLPEYGIHDVAVLPMVSIPQKQSKYP